MITVVRKTEKGAWSTHNVGVEDTYEAMQQIRRQEELSGADNKLFAFRLKTNDEDGSPIFDFAGSLD